MANSTITGLTNAGTITGSERVAVDQAGTTKDCSVAELTPGLNAVVGDFGAGGTKGLVPAPAAGDAAAGKYLDAAGAYSVPAGTGGGSSTSLEAARAYRGTTQSLSDNTETVLLFDTESYDTSTIHDNSSNTGRLTCITAGKYLIEGIAEFAANATGARQLRVRLNGTTVIAAENRTSAAAGTATKMGVHVVYDLAASDYVELLALQNSGGSLNVNNGLGTTWFAMTLQGGTPASPTWHAEVFNANGTFTPHTGVTGVIVDGYGAGAAGAGGTAANAGPGGGAGEYCESKWVSVSGATAVVVGAGGTAGAAGADGTDGSDSSFGTLTFKGGLKGVGGVTNTPGAGGGIRGGSTTGALGTAETPNFFGGSAGGSRGNAGGGSGGILIGGTSGTNFGGGGGSSPLGGAGNGGAANTIGASATANTGSGGGGGGNGSNTVGGVGGSGKIVVYSFY